MALPCKQCIVFAMCKVKTQTIRKTRKNEPICFIDCVNLYDFLIGPNRRLYNDKIMSIKNHFGLPSEVRITITSFNRKRQYKKPS